MGLQNLPQLFLPKRHVDERGWFSELFHERRLSGAGISHRFVQDNHSMSRQQGTLRGLHFQLPPVAQAKLVTVLRGRILDVAVDIRKGSPTFGKYVSAELTADTGAQLYIPVGFAHGFITLEPDVLVMYKVSDYYSPEHDRGVNWNDQTIGVDWLMDKKAVLTSPKDKALPFIQDLNSPFEYDGTPLAPLGAPFQI